MAPRQRIRLREVRRSDQFDDQLTPAEIQQAEILSADEQDFLKYLLSQVRQILGTDHWNDPVPNTLVGLAGIIHCNCAPGDLIGNLVYVSGPVAGGRYTVRSADTTDWSKMPVMGMIVSKEDPWHADVRYQGPVSGLYTGLTPGKICFLGTDSRIVLTPPTGEVYVQKVGIVLDADVVLVAPDLTITKRRA